MQIDYNTIRNNINHSEHLVYWYDKDGHLLLVDNDKKSSKIKIKKINYNGILYRLNISFHTGTRYGQGGPLAVNCRIFNKENKTITKIKGNKNGVIWFDKKWLENMNWKQKYLDIIIKKLKNKLEFKIAVYIFHLI